jgi:hypothetical protein
MLLDVRVNFNWFQSSFFFFLLSGEPMLSGILSASEADVEGTFEGFLAIALD